MEEEYQLLSLVLRERYANDIEKGCLLRSRFAVDIFGENVVAFYTAHVPGLEAATLEDAVSKTLKSKDMEVEPAFDVSGSGALVVPEARLAEIFAQRTGWEDFRRQFPGASGLFEVSRVGFNELHNQAVLSIGFQRDWRDGRGHIFWLAKGSRWEVKGSSMAWVS
jgi:hypothetical protein